MNALKHFRYWKFFSSRIWRSVIR